MLYSYIIQNPMFLRFQLSNSRAAATLLRSVGDVEIPGADQDLTVSPESPPSKY